MAGKTRRRTMTIALAVLAAMLVLPWALNGWFNSWGTTPAETAMALPGDDLIPSASGGFTHAVTIDAPPEKVWPWVVQIGMERAGWYTYDWFYALTRSGGFVDGHSSDRIVPELQALKVGDVIKMNPAIPFEVVQLEPTRAMVLKADGEDAPSWVWVLEPLDGGRTRLVERFRQGGKVTLASRLLGVYVLDSGGWVFSSKHLRGVKERAERQ
jgi:uncharacterized protein YndB with AHSA1/START domain